MEDEILSEDILDDEDVEELEPNVCDCGECEECIEKEGECTCGDCDICLKDEDSDVEDLYDDLDPEDML